MKHFLELIQELDDRILQFINNRVAKTSLKPVMAFFSHPPYWRQLGAATFLGLVVFGSNQLRIRIMFIFLVILLSDQTCNLIKALVKRVRPDGKRTTEGNFWQKLGHYSFPSSHAANTFAIAVLVSHWVPFLTVVLYSLAGMVSFSRVYRNNHYPSDVVVGGIIGIGFSIIVTQLFKL